MIHLITNRLYDATKFEGVEILNNTDKFLSWWESYKGKLQVDTETNIVVGTYGWKGHLKGINKTFVVDLDEKNNKVPQKRECYVVQIGDESGKNQWLFDIPELEQRHLNAMLLVLKSNREKILHNALFDYTTIKWCFGIDISNILDTFLMSQVIYSGFEVGEDLPKGFHSLVGCAKRYLDIDLSKAAQTTFTGKLLTPKQVTYAAIDVAILGELYKALNEEIEKWELYNTLALEQSVLRSYGDSMCENLYLDTKMWTNTMIKQEAEVKRISKEFFDLLKENLPKFKEETLKQLEDLNEDDDESEKTRIKNKYITICNLIADKDYYEFKWSSSKTKSLIMKHLYPDLPEGASTVKHYKDFYQNNIDFENYKGTSLEYINLLLNRDFKSLENYLINNHKDLLLKLKIYTPKGKVLMNLNSSQQKLALFQCIDDSIESTNKEIISKIDHPLAHKLKEYNKAAKMATSYGQNFLEAVNPDGMFRISGYKQILATGRSSMDKMQLLPGTSTYRNPFVPNNPKTGVRDDGYKWVVVGADYASQEAVVAATFCKEESLLKAIEEGCDFHSTCASLMFPEEWKKLGGDPKPKSKPEDKTLQDFRNKSKAVSFGLFYGKSAIGLGESLNIPATTKDLVENNLNKAGEYLAKNQDAYKIYCSEYYKGKDSLTSQHTFFKKEHKEGRFLADIITADDLIDRFYSTFPNIHSYLTSCAENAVRDNFARTPDVFGRIRRFIKPETTSEEASIKRAAMNLPIQGSSANMTKYAICLIKKHIEDNNLNNKLKFALPLHDEIRYLCREDFAEEGLKIIIDKMEESAEVILKNKLLKAEGEITEVWEK